MLAKQIRDKSYYLARLQNEFPSIYADFMSGRYSTAREAFIAAGLVKPTDHVGQLHRIWKRTNRTERAEFLKLIEAGKGASAPMTTLTDSDRYLLPLAKIRLQRVMDDRNLENGDVMREIGFTALDTSLKSALADRKPRKLHPALDAALTIWLNEYYR